MEIDGNMFCMSYTTQKVIHMSILAVDCLVPSRNQSPKTMEPPSTHVV